MTGWLRVPGWRVVAVAGLAALVVACGTPPGTAIELPGITVLNAGPDGVNQANVNSVSCASAGNCLVGGDYSSAGNGQQALVASEVNGTWQDAIEVPGTAALGAGGASEVNSVSCASPGNCLVGGDYYDRSLLPRRAFVASEVNGVWGTARKLPGTAALSTSTDYGAKVTSVSCASAGNCLAGGYYTDGRDNQQAFVASELDGTWHDAIEVPGTATLNAGGGNYNFGGGAAALSVSCGSAGNCLAGGYYSDSSEALQAFAAREVNGTWDDAIEVPGTAALNVLAAGPLPDPYGGPQSFPTGAEVVQVSCTPAGYCAAGGTYVSGPSTPRAQVFAASEMNGTWREAIDVSGTGAFTPGQPADVRSLSCPSAWNCAAGGSYTDTSGRSQAYVASEVKGAWHAAIEVPGIAALNVNGSHRTAGDGATVLSVACASAGNCLAGGYYTDRSGKKQAFVASEVNGTWHRATQVPGTAALNAGSTDSIEGDGAKVGWVSCPPAGNCLLAGVYLDRSGNQQAFVASEDRAR